MGKQGKRTGRTPASSDKDKSPKTPPSSSPSSPSSSPKDKEKPKPDTSTEPNNPSFYLDLVVPDNKPLTCSIDMHEVAASTFHVSRNSELDTVIQNAIHHAMLSTLEKAYGKIEDETVHTLWEAAKECYHPTAVNPQVFRFHTTTKPKTREPIFRILAPFKGDSDAKPIIHCEIPQPYLNYFYKNGISILMDPNVPEEEYDNYSHLFPPHLQTSLRIYNLLIEKGQPHHETFRNTIMADPDGNYCSYISLESLVSPDSQTFLASATKQSSDV
jgi:hypothetical protein